MRCARASCLRQAEINDHEDEPPRKSSDVAARPSRKVVDPPGGKQNFKLYGEEFAEADALSFAPPKDGGPGVDVDIDRMEHLKLHVESEEDLGAHIEDVPESEKAEIKDQLKAAEAKQGDREAKQGGGDRVTNPPPNFRPTRKVREGEWLALVRAAEACLHQVPAASRRWVLLVSHESPRDKGADPSFRWCRGRGGRRGAPHTQGQERELRQL